MIREALRNKEDYFFLRQITLRKKPDKISISAFDIETTGNAKDLISISYVSNNGKRFFYGKNILEKFWKCAVYETANNLKTYLKHDENSDECIYTVKFTNYLYAHNVMYDASGVWPENIHKEGTYIKLKDNNIITLESILMNDSKLISLSFNVENKSIDSEFENYIKEDIMKHNRKLKGVDPNNVRVELNFKIIMLDSMNIYPMSLKKLGQSIGIEKIDYDVSLIKNNMTTQDILKLKKYNLNDSIIVYEAINLFQQFMMDNKAKFKPYSLAGNSLSLFQHSEKFKKSIFMKRKIWEDLKEAYAGGMTEVFNKSKLNHGWYYDYNSLYPSVMVNNDYPDLTVDVEEVSEETYKNFNIYDIDLLHSLLRLGEGVAYIKIKYNHDFVSPLWIKRNKLYFGISDDGIYKWLSFPEIRQLIKEGAIIEEFHKAYYWNKRSKLFTDHIKFLYEERLKLKKEKNPRQLIYKLLMNSLYGKFGEIRDIKYSFNSVRELINLEETYDIKDIVYYDDSFSTGYVTINEVEYPNHSMIILALYTTAYARLKIYNAIKEAYLNDAEVYYCDTDSIVLDKPLWKNGSNKLGEFKLEYEVYNFHAFSPKFYEFVYLSGNEKLKISKHKGIPSDYKKWVKVKINNILYEKKDYEETEWLEIMKNTNLENIQEVHYLTVEKIKSALRHNRQAGNWIISQKKISLETDKRDFYNFQGKIYSSPKNFDELNETKVYLSDRKEYESMINKTYNVLVQSDLFDYQAMKDSSLSYYENRKELKRKLKNNEI